MRQPIIVQRLGWYFATAQGVFTFDAPVVTSISSPNGPPDWDVAGLLQVLTVSGINFVENSVAQDTAYKTVPLVGGTACGITTFVSTTSLQCAGVAGLGLAVDISFVGLGSAQRDGPRSDMVGLSATLQSSFSYDAPIVTHFFPKNRPLTGGSLLTVNGWNFGNIARVATIGVALGCTVCLSSRWVSNSAVVCTTPRGQQKTDVVMVRTAKIASQQTSMSRPGFLFGCSEYNNGLLAPTEVGLVGRLATSDYSYDSPVINIRDMVANGPVSGGQPLSISGLNFAVDESRRPTSHVTIGASECSSVVWLAASVMSCTTRPGLPEYLHASKYRQRECRLAVLACMLWRTSVKLLWTTALVCMLGIVDQFQPFCHASVAC